LAAAWIAGELVDGSHAEVEYDGDQFPDGGLTIDALWALTATGDPSAGSAGEWLAEAQNATDYAGDGEIAAYTGAMAKLGLAYLTPGAAVTPPPGKSPEELMGQLDARLSPEGRFRDISEWGDNATPMGQAFGVLLSLQVEGAPEAAASSVRGLVEAACQDGSYPSTFSAGDTCVGDVDTTAVAAQALSAAGETAAAGRAFAYLLSVQTPSGRWRSLETDSVNSTALAVGALTLAEDEAAGVAVQSGTAALADWQDANTGAFPAGESGAGDLRSTAQGVLGLLGVSYPALFGIGAE
jgi:hypothetical protein